MKIVSFLLLMLPLLSFSQDLGKHLWKDRLVLVITDSYENPKFTKQLKEFESNEAALKERKLIVYQITPNSYRKGFNTNKTNKKNNLYKKYNATKEKFKIILIGLDGGTKIESLDVVSAKKIFDKIDQMPMRRQELKIKN